MTSIRNRTAGSLAAMGLAALTLALAGGGAAGVTQAPPEAGYQRCAWSTDQLPRTPDAVEGWYRGCTGTTGLRSPTAVEGWAR